MEHAAGFACTALVRTGQPDLRLFAIAVVTSIVHCVTIADC